MFLKVQYIFTIKTFQNFCSNHILYRIFDPLHFWLPMGVIVLIGIVFTNECVDSTFMNRQQTEEWKGKHWERGCDHRSL